MDFEEKEFTERNMIFLATEKYAFTFDFYDCGCFPQIAEWLAAEAKGLPAVPQEVVDRLRSWIVEAVHIESEAGHNCCVVESRIELSKKNPGALDFSRVMYGAYYEARKNKK